MASLNAIADSFVNDLPKEISTTDSLNGKLPSVGRGCSAAWSSNNSSVVSVGYSLSLGGPCTVTVTLPKEQDATVTLTLNLTYNQRSDLKVERTAQVTVKKDPNYKPVDYQAVLDKAFQTVGMTDYVTGAALDQNTLSMTSAFPAPATWVKSLMPTIIKRASTANIPPSSSPAATPTSSRIPTWAMWHGWRSTAPT